MSEGDSSPTATGHASRSGDDGVFGQVTTRPYPLGNAEPARFGARTPHHEPLRCEGSGACARACPVDAIKVEGRGRGARFELDLGRCVFCAACVDACPTGALQATTEFELAARSREDLVTRHVAGRASDALPSSRSLRDAVKSRIDRLFSGSLAVREVDAGSCNGCEVEVGALTWPDFDSERLGIHFVASPRHADVLLVTGPVTRNMRLALTKTWEATPAPKFVIAVGACGISGGPFRGSPQVAQGVDPVLPVEVWVPGCPPRPEALLYAFWLALGKVEPRLRQGELQGKETLRAVLTVHPADGKSKK